MNAKHLSSKQLSNLKWGCPEVVRSDPKRHITGTWRSGLQSSCIAPRRTACRGKTTFPRDLCAARSTARRGEMGRASVRKGRVNSCAIARIQGRAVAPRRSLV
ncbi:hypothetical protein H8959_014352 [Pygathrix nigripes]